MNQENGGNNDPNALGSNPMKRKRGRPRKTPGPGYGIRVNRNFIPIADNVPNPPALALPPPGFQKANNPSQPQQVAPFDASAYGIAVGQVATAVIEGVFKDGVLLSVRVGDPEVTLKGMALMEGRYVPVTPVNDIAPNVSMIHRHEVLLPQDSQTQAPRGVKSRPKNRNEARPTSSRRRKSGNPGSSRNKQVTLAAAAETAHTIPSSNIVPVVLQPVSLSDGTPQDKSRGKQVDNGTPQDNSKEKEVASKPTPAATNQVPTAGREVEPREVCQASVAVQHRRLPSVLYEQATPNIVQSMKPLSQSGDARGENANASGGSSSCRGIEHTTSVDRHQAFLPGGVAGSSSISKPGEGFRPGKMTELLRVN